MLAGVIGGLIGFGIIGLFVGPVILAVTFKLLEAWITGPSVEPSSEVEEPRRTPDRPEGARTDSPRGGVSPVGSAGEDAGDGSPNGLPRAG